MNQAEQVIFEKAMNTIKSQQAQLENLTSPVYPVGAVVAVFDKSVIVDMGNAQFECERTNGTDASWIGSTVQVHPKTGQVVKRSPFVRYGQTATVSQITGNLVILSTQQGNITTEYSQVPLETLETGDQVVLNPSNIVIMKKLDIKSKYAFTTQTPLDWSDIGGCVEAKAELRKALELPYTNAEVFKFFHKQRVKGGILWGRPGNGKTLIGRACAGAIARVHNSASVGTGFIYVKGPELLSKWVGDTEEAIRTLFDHARIHFKKYGYPAVIFIDEADALLTRRGTRTAAGMEQTVVPQFNAEMDGMEDSGAFVLLATNRVDILDPAITRPGRIDRKFYIGPPTKDVAPEIFGIHMRDIPLAPPAGSLERIITSVDEIKAVRRQIIQAANAEFFSDNYPLYKLETNKGTRIFTLSHLASGAMIAGLVERATSCAIDRNIDAICPDGLTLGDFFTAIQAIHREQFGLNHYDELKEYVEAEKLEVTGFAPCQSVEEISKPIPSVQQSSSDSKSGSNSNEVKMIAIAVGGNKGKYDA